MKRYIYSTLFIIFGLISFTKPAFADISCSTQYGGTQICITTEQHQEQSQTTQALTALPQPTVAPAVLGATTITELPKTGPEGGLLTLFAPFAGLLIGKKLLRVGKTRS